VVSDETLCPRCSAANPGGTRFCGKCGTGLAGDDTTEARPDPLIGAFIGGRFLVKRKLGEGGMGVVYEAEQTRMGRRVAIKFLHPHLKDESVSARFRNEAAAAARLDHPNTITVFDFGETEAGALYIAMEFVDGASLDDEIRRAGALEWRRAARIAAQIADSLADAHENGIVHRDLKPENVMLLARGIRKDIVKVVDFGIAKILEADGQDQRQALTRTGMVIGTPRYMSPEQIRGEQVDARSDIYSVGVIAYQMLTGAPPFDSESAMGLLTKHLLEPPPPFPRIAPAVQAPPELERLVLRMLAKNAAERPQTMGEVAGRIEVLLEPVTATVAASAKRGRGGLIAGIAAGALFLLGVGGAAAWYFTAGPMRLAPGSFSPLGGPPPVTVPWPPGPQVTAGQPAAGPPPVPLQSVPMPFEPQPAAGSSAGDKASAGKPAPRECSFEAGADHIAQAVRDALRDREARIRACAEGLSGEETARFSFGVAAGATRVSGVVADTSTGLEACLQPNLSVAIGDSDSQARTGDITISLKGSLGVEACRVQVATRKKITLPKQWDPRDGGVTEEELGSLVKDKLGEIKKKIDEMKKGDQETEQ
jgi:tRNA A-37 threonylcarbamoyl transferase component Bud32